MDLLRFGESTYIASHLPSRIWGHIGNPTRDFSPRPLGSKQLPKILASWLFQSLGKSFKLTAEGWKEAEKKKKISLFLCLSYTSFLTLAEVLSLHTRANIRKKFCEKRAGLQGAGGGLSFFSCHCSFPATDHTSLSLPSPCFRDVPTICEPETDNRNTGKINPRIKSFLSPSPPVIHSLLGWWQTNGAYPRSDLFEGTCLLRMKN